MKIDDRISQVFKDLSRPKGYIVSLRFESPTMEKRFRNQPAPIGSQHLPARRGRNQAEHDMREFVREEILLPSARWAYRASQHEYVVAQDTNPIYWRKVMRSCRQAAHKCWVYFDGGYITLQMEIMCKGLGTVHDKNVLMCGIESLLNFEINQTERNISQVMQDQYELARLQIYKDMLIGIESDFLHNTITMCERDKATILGNRDEME